MIPLDEDGNNSLTKKDGIFTITQLEVWDVKLSQKFNREQYLQRMQPLKDEH